MKESKDRYWIVLGNIYLKELYVNVVLISEAEGGVINQWCELSVDNINYKLINNIIKKIIQDRYNGKMKISFGSTMVMKENHLDDNETITTADLIEIETDSDNESISEDKLIEFL